ncbi:hypothetical protein M3Y94_00664300 [Aphelenchoides besseyi]|nr:hypothetical protein M3Y94_00664300 [Aphelenchoides besseyi]
MARFFVSLFSVLLFVSYCESALHRCIYPYYGGFLFDKCVEGEVAVKWRANQSLRFRLLIRKTYESNNFVLNINDFCQLWFYGRMNSYLPTAEWQFEDYSTLAVCSDPSNCDLKIDTNGTLRRLGRGAPRDPICSHMHLRNEINDEWVWTKVRLSGLPEGWLVSVDVANASLGSVTEYYDAPSCFKQLPAGNGFRLVDCSYALLSIKWKKTDVLTAVHLAPGMNMVERQFQFYINDQCSLYFTGITKKRTILWQMANW